MGLLKSGLNRLSAFAVRIPSVSLLILVFAAGVLAWYGVARLRATPPGADAPSALLPAAIYGTEAIGTPPSPPTATLATADLDPDVYRLPAASYPRGLNLVFFADGYLTWPEFEADVTMLVKRMRTVEPWQSYFTYNIFKIKPNEFDICEVKTKDERKPVLRCRAERINGYLGRVSVPGHFKVVVLSRRGFQSWANVARLSDSGIFFSLPFTPANATDEETTGWLFLHMLGHAFGLKDEEIFVIAKSDVPDSAPHLPDGPNCAPDRRTAEQWWGDLAGQDSRVGYFKGCAANREYVRPTKSSLMNLNDLSAFVPDYGPVSERYLRKVLRTCFSEERFSQTDDPAFFVQYPEFSECVG